MAIKTIWPITYTCGHTEDRDLGSKPAGERAKAAKWFGAHLQCAPCFRASNSGDIEARRAAEAEERRADAERDNLPLTLVGSQKQSDWALRIRHELIRTSYEALVECGDWDDADFEGRVLEPARQIDRARWWIDNREMAGKDLPELLADPGTLEDGATTENAA